MKSESFLENSNFKKLNKLHPKNLYEAFMAGIVDQSDKDAEKEAAEKVVELFHVRKHPSTEPIPLEQKPEMDHWTKLELLTTKAALEEEKATETLRCLWPFFQFARVIGMCPVVRQGNDLVVKRPWHPSWWMTWIALGIQIIMVGNAIRSVGKSLTTQEIVKKINHVIYYAHTLMNCLYMIMRIKDLPKLLASCKRVEKICKKHRQGLEPDGLVRHCFLLLTFYTIAQVLGNALYFLSIVEKNDVGSVAQFFNAFNSEFLGDWGSFYSGVFFCLGEFFSDLGWAYADILLSIISVVFGWFFKRLNLIMAKNSTLLTLTKVEELRTDHRQICHLVEVCNSVFSPLFLLNYTANVAYLFTRLYTGFSNELKDAVLTVRIESLYAFCYQIIVKILVPTYFAARLHELAHDGLRLIHNWSSALEVTDCKFRLLVIGRFVSQLVTTPVGISGCGFFLITKNFMVTLISALVTYEVIILQFQGATIEAD